jgi:hypothetical protein
MVSSPGTPKTPPSSPRCMCPTELCWCPLVKGTPCKVPIGARDDRPLHPARDVMYRKYTIPRRIIRLHVLALNYRCSTLCQNTGVSKFLSKFALELVLLQYGLPGKGADTAHLPTCTLPIYAPHTRHRHMHSTCHPLPTRGLYGTGVHTAMPWHAMQHYAGCVLDGKVVDGRWPQGRQALQPDSRGCMGVSPTPARCVTLPCCGRSLQPPHPAAVEPPRCAPCRLPCLCRGVSPNCGNSIKYGALQDSRVIRCP